MADERLRSLPAVEELGASVRGVPHHLAISAAREVIDAERERILSGRDPDLAGMAAAAQARAEEMSSPSLRPVINATGVVLHTNLGRAPLARAAVNALAAVAAGYSNLEYDLSTGKRGSRQHHVEGLLSELSGAEASLAVNNNAAAVMLALGALADGGEVIVSRGQLVEIGGSFRIPEILIASGARLIEVGTTNRTRVDDYRAALSERTAVLLRVHQSNFRTVGFVEQSPIEELCDLAAEHGLTVVDDLGSGAITALADEPVLSASVSAGADIVCSSGDKLLGGPQAGVLVGRSAAVDRCRAHPLARAVRIDKLQLCALEATLRLHRDRGDVAIPAQAMIRAREEDLLGRANRLVELIGGQARVDRATARAGGGTLPTLELEGPVCVVEPGESGPDALAERLRRSAPPLIVRVSEGRVILDPRTLADEEVEPAAALVRRALG